jgi:hypothetical protein
MFHSVSFENGDKNWGFLSQKISESPVVFWQALSRAAKKNEISIRDRSII